MASKMRARSKQTLSAALSILLMASQFAWAQDAPVSDTHPVQAADAPPVEAKTAATKDAVSASKDEALLKGTVTHSAAKSPLLSGSVQELPKGTTVDLTSMVNINSEVNHKGDEIWVQVSHDVGGQGGVAVPGRWLMHGIVTDAQPRKRGGQDGYVKIIFDKLVSPDKQTEVPFEANISTKKTLTKAVAKNVLIGSGHVAVGAAGGALLSVQMGGIPTAISTYGISVGVGAAIGGTIGLIGAVKRKGSISSIYPGDQLKLVMTEPVSLPGFNPAALPSAKPIASLKNFNILINKVGFSKDPWGDSSSKLMTLDLTVDNKTPNEYRFTDLAVVSDQNQTYYPSIANGISDVAKKRLKPMASEKGVIAFSVDAKRHHYWLVLLDRGNREELNRVPIN